MKVYLAGGIPKGKELENYTDWRAEYKRTLLQEFPDMGFLDPDDTEANNICSEEDTLFWFGHLAQMIKEADAVIVQADRKLGVGTSQEMLIAKYFNKPVITILPKDTHHRKTNQQMRSGLVEDWIHPFVAETSDLIVERLEKSTPWLKACFETPESQPVKGIDIIDRAIDHHFDVIKKSG